MLINKKINLIKYLNQTSQSIASFSQITTVYTLQNNAFIKWNKQDYDLGDIEFENFEDGKSYLIFTQSNASFNLDIGDQNILESVDITSAKQIDLYKGNNISVASRESVRTAYVTTSGSSWNNALIKWNKQDYDLGDTEFENFEDGKVYLIISNSVPYSFWATEPGDNIYLLKTEADELITTEDGYVLTTG